MELFCSQSPTPIGVIFLFEMNNSMQDWFMKGSGRGYVPNNNW